MSRIYPRFSIRWLLILVAISGVAAWTLVEVIQGQQRKVLEEMLNARSNQRVALWTVLAGGYAEGTVERLECQMMADWHRSRLDVLSANGTASLSSFTEDANQESRERGLVRRLGLGNLISLTHGFGRSSSRPSPSRTSGPKPGP
jgi:hypothetical protein